MTRGLGRCDTLVPSLGAAWTLHSEETAKGWLVFAIHLPSGAMVPPNPQPTRDPDGERNAILLRHERVAATDNRARRALAVEQVSA